MPMCLCDMWLEKIEMKSMLVTFKCPTHGNVTLDNRKLEFVRLPGPITPATHYPRRHIPQAK